jgi:hypothetical protein
MSYRIAGIDVHKKMLAAACFAGMPQVWERLCVLHLGE